MDELCWEDLVFIDESGADTRLVRRYARAPRGERACGRVPFGSRKRLTMVGGLGLDGLLAPHLFEGAMNTERFLSYLDEKLIPALQEQKPGAVVVLDNLKPHKAAALRETLEAAGLRLLYLPPYSPDLTPIEQAWSKVKTLLRSHAARSQESLAVAMRSALGAVTKQDAQGWFGNCGYAL